ncbi:hypothetical protein SAMN05444673_2108 [Bacillus sp. OV166]|nr:hypothetical protein SAMN05444673_2108 [Bacillus sp. OV166]
MKKIVNLVLLNMSVNVIREMVMNLLHIIHKKIFLAGSV